MKKKIDLKGKKFGKLIVLEDTGERRHFRVVWKCKCDCGKYKNIVSQSLLNGSTKSCGCLHKEFGNIKHSMRYTSIYKSWCSMKQRCLNPNDKRYNRYGGRGIIICERWMVFENFLEDMGERPEGKTLDRIDNDGNYELSNCRWATPKEQANNRGKNV